MSIIIAVTKNDRTVMAADTLSSFGDSERAAPENSRTAKIYRIGDAIFGTTGWAVYDDIIQDMIAEDEHPPALDTARNVFTFFLRMWHTLHDKYPFVNDQAQNKDSPFGDLDSSFLIASPGGIFKVSSDMGVSPFKQYYSVGSGSEYALGAVHTLYGTDLDAATIAKRAVETAIVFDTGCGGEVDVMEVGGQ